MHSIYKITNIVNGKLYIGQTSKEINIRLKAHIKCAKKKVNRYLYDSMNKHGYDNFLIELIEIVETKNDADCREIYWIEYFSTLYPQGYNMTPGGGGGYTLTSYTEEQKFQLYKKQSENRKGYKHTDETKKKIADSKMGQSLSIEHKKHISETLKEKYKSGEITPTLPPIKYGFNHHEWVDIDKEILLNMIKNGYTIEILYNYFKCGRTTIINRIKLYYNKSYNELRKEFNITNRKKTLE